MNRNSPSGPRITWQGPVDAFANLPLAGNKDGDVRVTTSTDEIWIWNGVAWVPVSSSAGGTNLETGPTLTDADAIVAVAQRYVLPEATLTAMRTLTIAPPVGVGAGFLIEVGTQAFDYAIDNGGPLGGTLYTVLAGTKFAVWAVSDGADAIIAAFMPLAAEPS